MEGVSIDEFTAAIQRILAKLSEVRRRGLTCFGADRHRFRLNRPLGEGALERFERTHCIRLPDDYRAFLRLAGNGGAGPYYGLEPLERWNDAVLEELPNYLARPSPLRPDMPADVDWHDALGCPWEELFQGTLALVHQGCSYHVLLVVTGTYRGRVVYVNLDRCGTPYFVRDANFLAWYERWLDELLWNYDVTWFGSGLPGRETDMVAALLSAGDGDLHSEALATLARMPALARETLAIVRAALDDASPRARAQAANLLSKHGAFEAAVEIQALVEDADPSVRVAAVAALARLPAVSWAASARSALGDTDREVVFRALCLLKDAHLLHRADVERMLRSSDPIVRRDALWASDSVIEGRSSVPIPDEFFHDADPEARRRAILTAGERADRSNLPRLLDLLRRETEDELVALLVQTLGKIGDPAAVPVLIDMTRHADGFVRQNAARSLGKLKDTRAIAALEALRSDHTTPERRTKHGAMFSSWSVGEEARRALACLRPPWYRRLFARRSGSG